MIQAASSSPPNRLIRPGRTIAYHRIEGKGPGVMFLGGFMSDMTGQKAMALDAHCRAHGRAFVRFDYGGHGQSSGSFEAGTIGSWLDDACAVLDGLTRGPQVVVGSSLGGWLMLLLALARPDRIAGLIGVAAAPDFTEDLLFARFDAETRARLERDGRLELPSDYADGRPYPISRALIEEGRRHLVLRGPIPLACPVRLFHGMTDPDVPWQAALRTAECLAGEDVALTLIKDGDHRLSRPADLARLCAAVEAMAAAAG
jgi:pimeloyl-ACP methyl ester carboxylesterase